MGAPPVYPSKDVPARGGPVVARAGLHESAGCLCACEREGLGPGPQPEVKGGEAPACVGGESALSVVTGIPYRATRPPGSTARTVR